MNKLKSIGFASIYLAISFVVQIIVIVILMFHMLAYNSYSFTNGNANGDLQNMTEQVAQLEEKVLNNQNNIILVGLINLIFIAGYGLWYYFIRTRRDISDVSYRTILSARTLGCTFGLAVCGQFVCNIIMIIFSQIFPTTYAHYVELAEGLDIHVLPAAVMLFIVAIWSPLAEELIFRAMIFRTLRKGFSFWPAALISGILFGVYHLNWVQGVYASILGVLLAYTYEKTNSLLGCYLLHFMFNMTSYGLDAIQKSEFIPEIVLGMIFLVLQIAAFVGIVFFIRWYSRIFAKPEEKPQDVLES